jgi:Glycosyltransferase family 87
MWFYVLGILRAHQMADSAAQGIPRGNLSDLYPRWVGARELLLNHRNPYSREVTLEIQEGYYGRQLDARRPHDPKDEQGFAYPAYVVFLLAPLIGFRFAVVHTFFYWVLTGVTVASVGLWLRLLRWCLPPVAWVAAVLLTLGSFPAVQGIRLQQLSLLVAALLAGGLACVSGGLFFCGGALLAMATIKPQLAWPALAWLLAWTVADWRKRRRFLFGFGLVMGLLLAGAEIVLPGWWGMFFGALREYHRYTQNKSVLDELVPWMSAGKILAAVAIAASAVLLWKLRRAPFDAEQFGRANALVMALTVLVVPMYAPYNQVLLLPAILSLLRDRRLFLSGSRALRFCYLLGFFALIWPWIASAGLTGAYLFLSPGAALSAWGLPFFLMLALPVLVFGLTVIDARSAPA